MLCEATTHTAVAAHRRVPGVLHSSPDVSLEVFDVAAHSPPPDTLCRLSLRIHQWLHPTVVQAACFVEVDDGEAVGVAGSHVAHTKVVPLGVLASVQVRPQV